jgi:hypothetical protein
MRVLISWIGPADLCVMAAEQIAVIQQKIGEVVGGMCPLKNGVGPVRTLVQAESFVQTYLLSNYTKDTTELCLCWLKQEAEPSYISLSSHTDYGEIYAAVDTKRLAITTAFAGQKYELFILLSPDTFAIAAIWVLLGKTKYPACFYQSHEDKTWITNIPYDLTVDSLENLPYAAAGRGSRWTAYPNCSRRRVRRSTL